MWGDDSGAGRPRRRSGFKILPIILLLLYGVFYYFSNRQTVPITGRSQIVELTRAQEIALGIQAYREVLGRASVLSSGRAVAVVRTVGERIARSASIEDFQWEFNVIASRDANAFCLPGGKVVVNAGILEVTENEDGLAVVLGHEIAHALARHGAERMAQQQLVELGRLAVGMAVSEMDINAQRTVLGAFGLGSQFGVLLPFSRTHESEADRIGLILMARACFNPDEAPRFWQRMMRRNERGSPPSFLSTHPSDEERIERIRSWLPEALAERAKHCADR
jgi:predicted Zn-dependent protease